MIDWKKRENERGFTLVELAIVIVIIGILLGGIIKGRELIQNAKVKRTYSTYKELAAAINTYQDRYKFLPGDDPQATTRGFAVAVTNGNGNGIIGVGAATTDPDFTCTATGTEQADIWSELRQSGIISEGNGFVNPTHPFGGAIAVSYYNAPAVAGGQARLAHWIHFQNVPFDVAQQLDRQYDDGNAGTGDIRGTNNYMTARTGIVTLLFRF
jgi:prepilin-type N-terminal cleavage/methylation domain-containing protein